MQGNLKDRPLLLLVLMVMRAMLWFCIAGLVLVGGGIWFSITTVEGRTYENFTNGDTLLLSFIAALTSAAGLLLLGVHRLLKQNQ